MDIYQNLTKTKTLRLDKRGDSYVIVEETDRGFVLGKWGRYKDVEKANRELRMLADDKGFRWIGRVKG
jgi:hypothetical protein